MIEAIASALGTLIGALLAERARATEDERAEIDRLLAQVRATLDAGAVTRADADLAERIDRG